MVKSERATGVPWRDTHVLEKLLERLAFDAPDSAPISVVVDQRCVAVALAGVSTDDEISRFSL